MPINDLLLKDERILASAKASEGGTLYATNKRVIRYQKGFFGEKMDSLYYAHIVGASYESQSYIWLVVVGIVLMIFGFWTFDLLAFIGVFGSRVVGASLVLGGVALVLFGIYSYFSPSAWYQLKSVGLSETELTRWRTANVEADAKALARFIQEQIDRREIPPPPPPAAKEVITKEIVMIKCDYCGALMPQTATFCPNCGAKRR